MSCAAGSGDDHLQSALLGSRSVFKHPVGRAMRGDDALFKRNLQFAQNFDAGFKHLIVAAAAHDYADQRRSGGHR